MIVGTDGRGDAIAYLRTILLHQGEKHRNRTGLATVYGTVIQSGGCVTVLSNRVEEQTFKSTSALEETIEVAEKPKALLGHCRAMRPSSWWKMMTRCDAWTRMFLEIKGYNVLRRGTPRTRFSS